LAVIRERRPAGRDGLDRLLTETRDLVAKLVRENRALKARNARLSRELDRVSAGWEELRKLARSAPRRRRGA
jgi:cell division protein FtsB